MRRQERGLAFDLDEFSYAAFRLVLICCFGRPASDDPRRAVFNNLGNGPARRDKLRHSQGQGPEPVPRDTRTLFHRDRRHHSERICGKVADKKVLIER